ncbi:MAG: hypothetical protein JSS68_15100 [Actinobacteria bacterium]|nr:hypothetical protein [Actinomycetota bacterium]
MAEEISLNVVLQTGNVADPQTILSALIDSTARIAETGRWQGPIYNSDGDQVGTYQLNV